METTGATNTLTLLTHAVQAATSDIHIEPREHNAVIRYRIDGLLRQFDELSLETYKKIVSSIKSKAQLSKAEHDRPQAGQFAITIDSHPYIARVSIVPVRDGEKVVLHLSQETGQAMSLEELGLFGESLRTLQRALAQPHGLIIVSGPDGSGRSTSLRAMLNLVSATQVAMTIEDPIEYKLPGIQQTELNPAAAISFASGLRSILRHDPKVVMVGEIRDEPTARLCIGAAEKTQLILGGLHTYDAVSALVRLNDMGIEPHLVAESVRVINAQRLLRRLCSYCRESYEPNKQLVTQLATACGMETAEMMKRVHELEAEALAENMGLHDDPKVAKGLQELSSSAKGITRLWRAHRGGCDRCDQQGYQGRIGAFEVLHLTPAIAQLFVGKNSRQKLYSAAKAEGMIPLPLDGCIKALRGLTTWEEVQKLYDPTPV